MDMSINHGQANRQQKKDFNCLNSRHSYFWVMILTLACSGCDNLDDIVMEDDVEFPDFEFTYQLPDNENVGLKVAGFSVSGSDRQSIADGDLIDIEDTRIWGPEDVSHSVTLEHIELTLFGKQGSGQAGAPRLNGTNFLGIAHTRFDLTLVDQDTRYTSKQQSTSLFVGYGIEYHLNDFWGASLSGAYGYGFDLNSFTRIDLGLEYRPIQFLTVRTGYRWFSHYWTEPDDDLNSSSIDIDLDGPFLSLGLVF